MKIEAPDFYSENISYVNDWGVDSQKGPQALAMSSQVRLRVLARDVSIAVEKPDSISIRNRLQAEVEEIVAHPSEPAYQLVKLKCPNGEGRLVSRILNQSVTELGLHPGSQVWALVKASAVIM